MVPVGALVFQIVPPVLLWLIARAAYGEPRLLPEPFERPVSLATLAFSAGTSLLLGGLGIYRLLVDVRPVVAWILAVVCCGPALLGGALYLQALLVFLGWI